MCQNDEAFKNFLFEPLITSIAMKTACQCCIIMKCSDTNNIICEYSNFALPNELYQMIQLNYDQNYERNLNTIINNRSNTRNLKIK